MKIPDEAIEAGASYLHRTRWMISEVEAAGVARSTIEAAVPHIAAQALREASAAYPLETAYGGAEHAVLWLNERADNLEAVPTGAASVTSPRKKTTP